MVTRQWKAQDIIRNNCNDEKVINKQYIYIETIKFKYLRTSCAKPLKL